MASGVAPGLPGVTAGWPPGADDGLPGAPGTGGGEGEVKGTGWGLLVASSDARSDAGDPSSFLLPFWGDEESKVSKGRSTRCRRILLIRETDLVSGAGGCL